MKTEAETGGRCLRAKEQHDHRSSPEASEKHGRIFPQSLHGTNPADNLALDLWPLSLDPMISVMLNH